MTGRWRFATGVATGAAAILLIGAASSKLPELATPRPVKVVLHRFDVKPGQQRELDAWVAFLRSHHRQAVATLARERTYFEGMFTDPAERGRLYWITVQGAGGALLESSEHELDRRHLAYMDAVLVKGSHRRLETRNVLAPDFAVRAVAAEQRRER